MILEEVSGQTIFQPIAICNRTTLELRSRIDPVSPTFAFNWVLNSGGGDVSFSLFFLYF